MNKWDNIVLKGDFNNPTMSQPTTSTTSNSGTTTTTTTMTPSTSNTIQPLYVDLNNNTNLNNNFTNFINNLMSDISTFLGYYNTQGFSSAGAYANFSSIIQSIIQGQLGNWTYAYDSNTLITLWNNNVQQLAFDIASDFGLYFLGFANAYYLALAGSNQTTNLVSGWNFGNVNTSAGSEYTANTTLNSTSTTTLNQINTNFNTTSVASQNGAGEGGFSYQWNPNSNTGYANGVNINNSAMSSDTTPIKDSSGTFHGSSTNQVQGLEVAKFLQENFKPFQQKLRKVLYDCFYEYLTPINNLDNDVWGYNW